MNSYNTQIICQRCNKPALAGSSTTKYCYECRDKIENEKRNERARKKRAVKRFEDTGKYWGKTKGVIDK